MLARGNPATDEYGKVIRDSQGKVVYEPYKIKVLNTINFKKSMHYNPFVYIRSEKDILKLVTTIIANTKGEGQQAGEDFWVKAEKPHVRLTICIELKHCIQEQCQNNLKRYILMHSAILLQPDALKKV